MADPLKVRITTDSLAGHSTRVYLNDDDISNRCRALTFRADAEDLTQLTLELYVHEVEIDGQCTVQLDDTNHDLLTRLGWTPPANTEGDPPCSDS